jgi:hypothetical protein
VCIVATSPEEKRLLLICATCSLEFRMLGGVTGQPLGVPSILLPGHLPNSPPPPPLPGLALPATFGVMPNSPPPLHCQV